MIKKIFKKIIDWMIKIGSTIIETIKIGSTTPGHIDIGSVQVWPDAEPSHVYSFSITHYSSNLVGYAGGTLVIYINSTCDGEPQDLSYAISDTSWCSFVQRSQNQSTDTWTYYFSVNSNSGSVRTNSITFTQHGSSNSETFNFSQAANTDAFDGMTIMARLNTEYGYWVIGTVDNGQVVINGNTYPNRAVVLATDQPITSSRRINFTLTASRMKSLPAPQSGTSVITLTTTQTIGSGSTVKPNTSSSGKTYYGAYVVLTDTSWSNGEWTSTPGTHTTMSPYPTQGVSNVSINYATTS